MKKVKVSRFTQPLTIILLVLLALIFAGWLGLQIQPSDFPPFAQNSQSIQRVALPASLSAPVDRFYRQLYGDSVPLIGSAVLSGHAKMQIGPVTFPGRFRFVHDAGQGYRHYIEVTFFGMPIMKINEHFLNGHATLKLPFGISEGEKVNQGANLALWAEAVWFPPIWLTDPRVRWQGVDAETAILFVPFGDDEESLVVRFDPNDDMLHFIESMRYQDTNSANKTLWLNEIVKWDTINDSLIPSVAQVIWQDNGKPWAIFTVNEVVYNAEIQDYIRADGP